MLLKENIEKIKGRRKKKKQSERESTSRSVNFQTKPQYYF